MNKKAFTFYFVAILIFALLVVVKQRSITKKNLKEAITYYSSWKKEGKPVVVQKVQKKDMESNVKLTLVRDSADYYIGYLSKGLLKNITLGSPVFIHHMDKKIPCQIMEIGSAIDLNSGMYPIKVKCSGVLQENKINYLAEVSLLGLKDGYLLPSHSVNINNKGTFVWVIRDGKAYRQFITMEERSCLGVVASGIDEKDLIVVEGSTALNENDPVKLNDGK